MNSLAEAARDMVGRTTCANTYPAHAKRAAVIDAFHRARAFGARVAEPPRTTWKGTPLHELWLKDPDGTPIESFARLTEGEIAGEPADEAPRYLVPGTEPQT